MIIFSRLKKNCKLLTKGLKNWLLKIFLFLSVSFLIFFIFSKSLPFTGLKMMYVGIQRDFWIGFSANFLGTLLAALLLYLFLERRVTSLQMHNEKIKLFKNLVAELITNYIIAERIITNLPISSTTDKFPVARFKFTHINNFLYARPIEKSGKFYLSLNSLMANMEMTNSLIDLVFLSKDAKAILENKKGVNESAPKLLAHINNLLIELDELNKKFKFVDEIEKPNKKD